mmetsp:Transcript_7696/g.8706  ORF Transcript_7696/g.8706 Transcript_7696/m.8706 type:complete len:166 (-) Transcript_7696:1-498(-)
MRIIFVAIAVLLFVSATRAETSGFLKGDKKAYQPGDIEIINSEHAPKPIGSYNVGTKLHYGGFAIIETAGQIGLDPVTNQLITDFEGQVTQAMKNLESIIVENGGSLDKVTRTQLFLSDMADFAAVDKIYSQFFTKNFPARAAVAVKDLPKYCFFEIMAEAVVKE